MPAGSVHGHLPFPDLLLLMSHPVPWLAYASLAASMMLVGSYVGLSKLLVAAFPVFLLAWLRFGIAALAMWRWVPRAADEAPLSTHDRKLLFWESFDDVYYFDSAAEFFVHADCHELLLRGPFELSARELALRIRNARRLAVWGRLSRGAFELTC